MRTSNIERPTSNIELNANPELNQAILLTAPGIAAIAVIRLAGPRVDGFLSRYFSKPTPIARCVHGLIRDGDRVLDDALIVRNSPTMADLNLHGGTWVVQSVLDLAAREGFEIAEPSPVTTEGSTELWKKVILSLPMAKTPQAVRMLLAQPAAWEKLSDPSSIRNDQSGQWMVRAPVVAIVGPANVGKSTLANQLFGQHRSITADIPGTTRDWVGELANLDGLAVMLVDTPGLRQTIDPIEDAAIAASAGQIRRADLIVLVLDQSLPLDRDMLAKYPTGIRVANKTDANHQWESADISAIPTIATTGFGLDILRAEIRCRFGWEPLEIERARAWTL